LAINETSFKKILQRVLIQHAADLLVSSSTPITQIALDLGYSDPAHFSRAFSGWHGESPHAWRRRLKAMPDQ
jgi:AraC-like DNA-binding protein